MFEDFNSDELKDENRGAVYDLLVAKVPCFRDTFRDMDKGSNCETPMRAIYTDDAINVLLDLYRQRLE